MRDRDRQAGNSERSWHMERCSTESTDRDRQTARDNKKDTLTETYIAYKDSKGGHLPWCESEALSFA